MTAYNFNDAWKTPPTPDPPPPPATNGHVPAGDKTQYVLTALTAETERAATAPKGTRNHALNDAAYYLGKLIPNGYLTADDITTALTGAAHTSGLMQEDGPTAVAKTITSGINGGIKKPRTLTDNDTAYIPPVTILPPPPDDELTAFWAARPILAHTFAYARARRVSPWAVLGVTLARIVTAVPPFIVLPGIVGVPASLNLFVGLVGSSGAGKGAAEGVAKEATDVGHLETATTGSGEGIAHAFMRRNRNGDIDQHATAVLFSVPEIDTLTALGDRRGATLMPELRRAWSGEKLGFAYADPAKRLPVPSHKYRLCLVAGIQPGRAGALLDDVDGGTPQRWIWLPAADPEAPDTPPECPAPYVWKAPHPGMVNPSGLYELTVTRTAWHIIDAARLARLRGQGDALDAHALLAQLKTAAALALAESRLEVTDHDWQLADVIARVSAATRSRVVAELAAKVADTNRARATAEAHRTIVVSQTVEDAAIKRVCKVIMRRLAKGEISRSDLRGAVASRDRKTYFDEALDRLNMAGQVTITDGHDGARVKLNEGK